MFSTSSLSHFLGVLLPLPLLVWGSFWRFHCLYPPQAQPSAADPDHTALSLRHRPMLLSSRATFVEWKRIVTTTKYTSFTLGLRSCRGKRAHKSLILAQCLVGEIKQRRTASPSRDGAPDKDLSMAHFSGTEGWKEGGWYEGREKSSSNCGKGCRAGAPSLLVWQKNSCWTNSISKWNMLHHSRLPSKEFREWGRFLWKAATFRLPFQNHPHHPKKTKKHSSISLSVLQRCRQSCTGAVPCWWSSGYWSTRTWIKLCMKRDLSSGENHMIMVPQVEVECRNQCLVVPIREPGL